MVMENAKLLCMCAWILPEKVQFLCSGITALYQFDFIAIKAEFIALIKYNFYGNYRSLWKLWMLFVSMGNNVGLRQVEIGITYSIFFHFFYPIVIEI